MGCGPNAVVSSSVDADGLEGKVCYSAYRRCVTPSRVAIRPSLDRGCGGEGTRRSLVAIGGAAEDFLLHDRTKIGLQDAGYDPADRPVRPALNRWRRDHAFQKAMKLIVCLDNIAISAAMRSRHQEAESNMRTPYTA